MNPWPASASGPSPRCSRTALLWWIVLVAACASDPSGFTRVKNSRERIKNPGYSVLPPEGRDWYVSRPYPGSVVFVKTIRPPDHTFSAAVMSASFTLEFDSPDEFMDFVTVGKKADGPPGRFKRLEYDAVLDPRFGDFCVKYHMKSLERQAAGSSGTTQAMTIEITGYAFIHPDAPDLVIDLNYSERYREGDSDPTLREVGEKFLDGFVMKPPEGGID